MGKRYRTKEELIGKAKTLLGKRIGDYVVTEELTQSGNKGKIGHVIESGAFGYDINSNQEPDFKELGIELKVTGYKKVYRGKQISAKERLVITMIDFFKDYNIDFYESHCYEKIAKMLLILYEYDLSKNEYDFIITDYFLYEFDLIPEKDRLIIENDYEIILNKIKDGLAHELSEGDTFYLGACPKGASSLSVVDQPFSSIKAMKRAYSLKTTYMTYLLRTNVFKDWQPKEEFIKDIEKVKKKTFSEIIYETFEPYANKSLNEIDSILNISVNREDNKQYIRTYVSKMMKVSQKNLDYLEEFEKANILLKTIRVNKKGRIKESMSFPAFSFLQVSKEDWENSSIREMFSSTKFLFIIFDEIADNFKEYRFRGVKLWNMPTNIIETKIKEVWEGTNTILNSTLVLNIRNGRIYNNFPKSSKNYVTHVRPHARDRSVTNELPLTTTFRIESSDGSVNINEFIKSHEFTKQCFWLNSTFIEEIISIKDDYPYDQ